MKMEGKNRFGLRGLERKGDELTEKALECVDDEKLYVSALTNGARESLFKLA